MPFCNYITCHSRKSTCIPIEFCVSHLPKKLETHFTTKLLTRLHIDIMIIVHVFLKGIEEIKSFDSEESRSNDKFFDSRNQAPSWTVRGGMLQNINITTI